MSIFTEEDLKSLPVNYLMVKKNKPKKVNKIKIHPFKYVAIDKIQTNTYFINSKSRHISTIVQSLQQ